MSEISIRGKITKLETVEAEPSSVNREFVHIGVTDDMKIFNQINYWNMASKPIPFKLGQYVRITLSDQDAI